MTHLVSLVLGLLLLVTLSNCAMPNEEDDSNSTRLPIISSSTLTAEEEAQRLRWQQALTYWNLLNSFKDTMTAQLDDGVVDAQEAETYCFTWPQWVKHMEDSLAHVREFKRLEPEFAANEPILIKLESEATRLLDLLHEHPC